MSETDTGKPRRKPRAGQAEHMRQMSLARSRTAREQRIAELIAGAPAFTPDQRARLITLLNANAAKAG